MKGKESTNPATNRLDIIVRLMLDSYRRRAKQDRKKSE